MIYLVPALVLGALGSFHCIGMCGPLAMSLPKAGTSTFSSVTGKLAYNAGRITTYAILGAILGLIGKGAYLTGLQQSVSILLGVSLIVFLIFPRLLSSSKLYSFPSRLKAWLVPLFKRRGVVFSFLIGQINGLLPCGLVYMAIAGALATGDPLFGLLFMVSFGLGTVPLMLLATFSGKILPPSFKIKIQKTIPAFVVLMATVLILRGMNLGIPYISPQISESHSTGVEECR